jgi:hypothetical protein
MTIKKFIISAWHKPSNYHKSFQINAKMPSNVEFIMNNFTLFPKSCPISETHTFDKIWHNKPSNYHKSFQIHASNVELIMNNFNFSFPKNCPISETHTHSRIHTYRNEQVNTVMYTAPVLAIYVRDGNPISAAHKYRNRQRGKAISGSIKCTTLKLAGQLSEAEKHND